MEKTYAFLDLETTGLNPDSDHIIEIGVVLASEGRIIDKFSTLVKSPVKVPPKIVRLTGITDEMLAGAPEPAEVKDSLLAFLGNLPIFGHNIAFDIGFLNSRLNISLKNEILDTLDFLQVVYPQSPSYRLESVKTSLGFGGTSHRALDDAETACRVFFACLDVLSHLDNEVLLQIYKIVNGHDWSFARTLTNHIYQTVSSFPSNKSDALYAFLKAEQDGESTLFDMSPKKQAEIDISNLADFLKPSGPFAKTYPQYKFRPEQVDMLTTVIRGFQESKHMIIEAGTGTGKSLAYLVPAIAWAIYGKTKVIVATHTINLQEQLWNKDIPEVREALGIDFKAALVKGRSNYVCLRRWESKLQDCGELTPKELIFILKVLVWLATSKTGDKAELNIMPTQTGYWGPVSSEQESCLGPACRWFHKQCFVSKARRMAESADLLIANHSLLLADIKIQNRILPAFDYLIIDEAHHLESTATEQLGWTISTAGFRQTLYSLNRRFGSGQSPGLLNQLKQALKNNPDYFNRQDAEVFDTTINEAFDIVKNIYDAVKDLEDFLASWFAALNDREEEDSFQVQRVKEIHRHGDNWNLLKSIRENLSIRVGSLIKSLKKIFSVLDSPDSEQQKKVTSLKKDTEFQILYLQEVMANLDLFFTGDDSNVYWIEIDKGFRPDTKIRSAPVSVSELLFENLFNTKKSTLLTSATISVDGGFDHFTGRVGLSSFAEGKVIKRQMTSPFSYDLQSLLCIVRDIPDPTTVDDKDYAEHVAPIIGSIAKIFHGKTLVLFTSHKMLRDVYYRLYPELDALGLTLLGHKIDGGRSRLMEEFKKSDGAVLFGASSFWEGIDLPGNILKCVIIVRLPFAPPNSPVVEARIEELVKNKKDAFYNYTVPEAVIKLKQGFGRLIRAEDDDGIVIVLDRRIVDRRYGRKFLNSLPIKSHFRGDSPTVLQKITDWSEGERPLTAELNILENSKDIEKFIKSRKFKQ